MKTHLKVGDKAVLPFNGYEYEVIYIAEDPEAPVWAVERTEKGDNLVRLTLEGATSVLGMQIFPPPPPPEPQYAWVNVYENTDGILRVGDFWQNRKAADFYGKGLRVGCLKVELDRRFDE